MIVTRKDLQYYLTYESKLYAKQSSNSIFKRLKNYLITNTINTQYFIYKYIVMLRYAEYHSNNSILNKSKTLRSYWHLLLTIYYFRYMRKISYRIGFQIPPNTCGVGLQIWHYGHIIINEKTRIGNNLTIYPGVEIGHKTPGGGCPTIGDNCFIGAGAKIFGKIKIGNNVTIAANSVVITDIPDNAIVGGIPAKILKFKELNH